MLSSKWNHITKCTWEIKPGTVDPKDCNIMFLQDAGTHTTHQNPAGAPSFRTVIIKMLPSIFYKPTKLQFL